MPTCPKFTVSAGVKKGTKKTTWTLLCSSGPRLLWYKNLLNWLYVLLATITLVATEEFTEQIMVAPNTSLL